jgi:Big-like domain-containing protein/beta-propeller repeat-containing protein
MKPKLFGKIRCFSGQTKAKKMIASLALVLLAIYLSQAQGMKPNKTVSTTRQVNRGVEDNKTAGALAQVPSAARPEILGDYGKLPLSFETNQGQTDAQVKFLSRGRGYTMFLTRRAEMVLVLRNPSPKSDALQPSRLQPAAASPKPQPVTRPVVVRMKLDGANATPQVEGLEELPGKANYFIGNDPAKWRTNVPTYARVQYHAVYPGVDLVYYGNQRQLEHDFIVAAGANPGAITLRLKGAKKLSLDVQGDLVLKTKNGEVRFQKPVIYQEVNGARQEVTGGYTLKGKDRVGFEVAAYDATKPLVIDPGLLYSTYLGGSGTDEGLGIALDGAGNAYVTGRTISADFPTTAGAFDTSFNGGTFDVFVTKLNPAGSSLVYSTYLGGGGNDQSFSIALDAAGHAHVTGFTSSADFPTTVGAFDTTLNGAGSFDVFVTKLDAAGSALAYSTYLGGNGNDEGFGIVLDVVGNAYVAGFTTSANFPTTVGAFDTSFNGGVVDAFVTKLNTAGSAPLLYSTYLGGSGDDRGLGIALDALGNAHVTGFARSADFPTTAGAFDTSFNGVIDAFVTKLNPAGSALVYSTYVGGSDNDQGFGIVLDGAGNAHLTGRTSSTNFPTTAGTFDMIFNGGQLDAFVTKLNAAGNTLVYSTYLGSSGNDQGSGITLDGVDNAHVTGFTTAGNFPTTTGSFDTSFNGSVDAFVTKLNAAGSGLVYSTYLGGSNSDSGAGIALDSVGNAHVTGSTASANFPTTVGAFDTSFNGVVDAFVTKLDLVGTPATLTLAPKADTNTAGSQHTVTATVKDTAGTPVPGVTVRFSVSGANSASGSDATDANGEATFTYTGTTAGLDAISAFADSDNDGTQDVGEPGDTATKLWTPSAPATLTLAPPAATNTVGTQHCLTATVRDAFGNPVPGVTVRFSVPTASATAASPASGSDVTDANGEATFCYAASLPGQDAIHGFADSDNDEQQDAGEPFGDATKTWTLPTSTAFCEVTITQGGWIFANNGDRANFGGNAKVSADGSSVQGQEEYQDHGPAQPLNVHSINLTATTCSNDRTSATIFGTATIDGSGSHVFRIDVSDMGSPGANDSYGIILDTGYASGQRWLQGGNVTIHK